MTDILRHFQIYILSWNHFNFIHIHLKCIFSSPTNNKLAFILIVAWNNQLDLWWPSLLIYLLLNLDKGDEIRMHNYQFMGFQILWHFPKALKSVKKITILWSLLLSKILDIPKLQI